MTILSQQILIEQCEDVLDSTVDYTPNKKLVEMLRGAIRSLLGLDPGEGLDPMEAGTFSRLDSHMLDIIRLVQANCDEKFDVRAVINTVLLTGDFSRDAQRAEPIFY
jgi:hypothetical protein